MRTPAVFRLAMQARRATTPRLLLALCAGLPLFACSDAEPSPREVRVRVEGVGIDPNDLPVVVLEEVGGTRWLPIWIGSPEARAIARQIEAVETPRPDTHDLARRMLDGLHGELERVVVTDLRSGTYYATLSLRTGGRRVEIDARPSDAIAIALRTDSPIFVREPLLTTRDALHPPPTTTAPSI